MPASRAKLLDRGGPWLAAAAAACAALPGLAFPFLSDDWHLIESVGAGPPQATPYGYFRPLYTATFWLDRRLWGLSPFGFHLTNLVLMAAAAFLVVVLVRRCTGDGVLSAFTGLLFALHPYHVENAAWIAVRGDPLYSALILGSALAYVRWRSKNPGLGHPPTGAPPGDGGGSRNDAAGAERGTKLTVWKRTLRGSPVLLAAWVLFELALLAKETAVVLPALLLLVPVLPRAFARQGGVTPPGTPEWLDGRGHDGEGAAAGGSGPSGDGRKRVPTLGVELLLGILPMVAIALAHFFLLRPLVMPGSAGRSLAPGSPASWARHALGYLAAAVLPVDAEVLAHRPFVWGGVAAFGIAALLLGVWIRHRRLPAAALAASAAFALLLLPSIIGFQERYLFLPVAASSLFLAALVRALRPGVIVPVALLLATVWTGGCVRHWRNWSEAAVASRHLVADLVAESARPEVQEIAVANLPFRVRGGSVAGDFRSAIALSGGRPVPVTGATYVSYPDARAPALRGESGDGTPPGTQSEPGADREGRTVPSLEMSAGEGFSEVRMTVPERPFSHYVAPSFKDGASTVRTPAATLTLESRETVLVRIEEAPDRGRAAYAWAGGRLIPLFLPSQVPAPPAALTPPAPVLE